MSRGRGTTAGRQDVPAADRVVLWLTQVIAAALTVPCLFALYVAGSAGFAELFLPVLVLGAIWLYLVWSPAGVFRRAFGAHSPMRSRYGSVPRRFWGLAAASTIAQLVVVLAAALTPFAVYASMLFVAAFVVVGLVGMLVTTVLARVAWNDFGGDEREEIYLGRPFIGVPPDARDRG